MLRLSWWLSGKESSFQRREQGFDPWSGKTPRAPGGTTEPASQLLSPRSRACAPQQELPQLTAPRQKAQKQQRRPSAAKNK